MTEPGHRPSLADRQGGPPRSFGTFYPKNHIIAVVADHDAAHRLEADLKAANFDGVFVADREMVQSGQQAIEQKRGILGTIAALFAADENEYATQYLEAVKAGRYLVLFLAPGNDDIERAKPILNQHNAENCRHYGDTTITEL